MTPTRSTLTVTSPDRTRVAVYRWDQPGRARAAFQLSHGMGEHARRYEHVAQALCDAGYVVYAQDHRGHGATARSASRELGDLGPGGWNALVDDIGAVSALIRTERPDLPIILLGHSMGSFAVQQYILDHSADVAGVVLTGTGVIDLLEPALDLDQPLDLAVFNAAFQPSRTDFDWLSRDESVVDAYVADPLCGFGIDVDAARQMFTGARRLADPDQVGAIRSDLPVCIAVGEADPVNGGGALLTPLVDRLRAAGLGDVTVVIYPGARHEVLNEVNRDEVIAALIGWADRITPPVR